MSSEYANTTVDHLNYEPHILFDTGITFATIVLHSQKKSSEIAEFG